MDRAEVLQLKANRLQSIRPPPALTCARRVCIPADILLDDWEQRLVEQGFDASLSTCWLMEGIVTYLEAEDALSLLRRVKALSAPGSRLAFDCVNGPMRFNPNMQRRMALLAADNAHYRLFVSRPEAFMARAGFGKNAAFIFPGDSEASFGRASPCPFLQAMRMIIRIVIALVYVGTGLLLGLFAPYYVGIPALIVLVVGAEGWAWMFQEWLERRLKLVFFPSAYFVEAWVN